MSIARRGPLKELRIVEFAGLGAAPFCSMLLAELGADVVRIDRPGAPPPGPYDLISRSRRSVVLDLKRSADVETALRLVEKADALTESFRPGVMEKLGLGPEAALSRNPRLVYGRLTGWGQTGPLARAAGHDLNYIALSGALHAIGSAERPAIPLNLVGDLGGGALYLALGLLAGMLHARSSGQGQVVDCAITDGAASLMTMYYGAVAAGDWRDSRSSNSLDGGAYFYSTYECADGLWIALGPLEPQFYATLLAALGIKDDPEWAHPFERGTWSARHARVAELIKARPRTAWIESLEGTDACFAPVLSLNDAPSHPHNRARETFVSAFGVTQPAPAPRFSRTPGAIHSAPPMPGEHSEQVLREWGVVAGAP
jgi:alpha-methylacyl-CoA racemase